MVHIAQLQLPIHCKHVQSTEYTGQNGVHTAEEQMRRNSHSHLLQERTEQEHLHRGDTSVDCIVRRATLTAALIGPFSEPTSAPGYYL